MPSMNINPSTANKNQFIGIENSGFLSPFFLAFICISRIKIIVNPPETSDDPHRETCLLCRCNLRDPIHRRAARREGG